MRLEALKVIAPDGGWRWTEKRLNGQKIAAVTKPYRLVHGAIDILVIPGFETDLTTVPRWLRWLHNPAGPWHPASIIHDYMLFQGYDRDVADLLFLKALVALRVPAWRRFLLYRLGVRIATWRDRLRKTFDAKAS